MNINKEILRKGGFILLLLFYIQRIDCQKDSLYFYHITTDNGLPTNRVRCMAQDSFGMLWFGTLNGLIRYSGTKFRTYQYDPMNENTIPSGEIKQLVAGNKIWGLTSDGNMFVFDYNKIGDHEVTRLNNTPGYPNFKIQLFHDLGTRMILIFDDEGKMWLLDKLTLCYKELKLKGSPLKSEVLSGITNKNGHYFGGIDVLYKLSLKLDSMEVMSCPDNVSDVTEKSNFMVDIIEYYSDDKILIASKNKALGAKKGIMIFDTRIKDYNYLEIDFGTNHSCNVNYDVINYLGDSTFYIKPIGTTSHYGNIFTQDFIKLKSNENRKGMLNTGSINNVTKLGDQLFVLSNQGINVSDPKRTSFPHFFVHDNDKAMASQMGSYLCEESKMLYIASRNYLRVMDFYNKKIIKRIPYPCIHSKHSQQQVEIIPLNKNEILIVSSYCYIFSLIDHSFISLEKEDDYDNPIYYDIFAKYNDQNLKIFSRNGELYTFNEDCRSLERIAIFNKGKKVFPKITGIATEDNKHIWVSTEDFGLLRLHLDQFYSVQNQWYEANYVLSDVIFDRFKNLWVTSKTHGLLKWDFNVKLLKPYSIPLGLTIYNMDQISEDRFGKFWIQTNQGITRLDPVSDVFINFDKRQGLRYPHNVFRGKTFHPNGNLYLSGGICIIEINPQSFDIGIEPKIWISNFETVGLKNIKIFIDTLLILEPFQNNISLEFDVINFDIFKVPVFEYSLGDKLNQWMNINPNESTLKLYNLKPGEYHLLLRSIYNKQNIKRVLKFIIKSPWHQTWWFRSLASMLFLLGVWWIIKFRTQRLLEKQKVVIEKELAIDAERKRIARDMHDDLGSGLSAIHLYSDYLRSNLAEKYPEISDDIQKIVLSSSELNQKVKEIIWSNESKMQSVSTVFQFLKKTYADLINSNQCNLQIHEISEENDFILDASTSKNIYLCLKEAINNSIKYSGAKNLNISFNIDENQISFMVQDDGKGFNVEERMKSGGKGLYNIINRMEEVNGKVEFHSNANGTLVKLIIISYPPSS